MRINFTLTKFEISRHLKDKNTVITILISYILIISCSLAFSFLTLSDDMYDSLINSSKIFSVYSTPEEITSLILNYIFPIFMLLFFLMIPVQIGISSTIGDKEAGCLETLLYLPVKKPDILFSKVASVLILSFSFVEFVILTQIIILYFGSNGTMIIWKTWFLFSIFTVPAFIYAICTITGIISIIAKSSKEANQYALAFCFILLIAVQAITTIGINIFTLDGLIYIGLIAAIIAGLGSIYISRNISIEKIMYGLKP